MAIQRRTMKKEILALLEESSPPEIFSGLERYPQDRLANALFSAICSTRERTRWNAVFAFGQLAANLAVADLEPVRIIMRRFLWSLNDESGGIGWGAPEAMAEIMFRLEPIRKEFLHMLLSYVLEDGEELYQDGNFIELPFLQRGVLWGIMRLAAEYPDEILAAFDPTNLGFYLESPDSHVVALAIFCLTNLGIARFRNKIESFATSRIPVRICLYPEVVELSLGEIARNHLVSG